MSPSNSSAESTEGPSQLTANLPPVQLKYVPLPTPLPALDKPISLAASAGMRPPCRRCLLDASPGEELHLIAYDPFPVDSATPYRGTGPIFIHAYDCGLFDGDALPDRQLRRQMSIRAYDERHMMVAAETIEGGESSQLERVAGGMLADEKASYINVHNAKAGCFAVRIERA
ncbi:hypothetical protein FIBSPDRAFT_868191 [Athelia psychrophila]|uniref:DUF1203 domain-containing protein n=1 Tax=Athelia psychrophila TaxID=1759441 RepID=A0A166DBC6_9AGAM|nr:hypothetical protein FIBSPDRAFT_868191 [Fibularhizoctonia sp. CBS 109695]